MAATLDRDRAGTEKKILPGPVGFIGAGKVGTALAALLHERGADVVALSGRDMAASKRMAKAAGLPDGAPMSRARTLRSTKIVFLTVPDDAIGPLCEKIAEQGGWREGQGVVHCSGALSSDVLRSARACGALAASFHPLQAFASLEAAIQHIPGSTFALEGDAELVSRLDTFVGLLGGTSLHLSGDEKAVYHAAAVVASNYMVTLAALASEMLVRGGIAPDSNKALGYLMPLLKGTVDNLQALGLPDALTGPLARGDVGTVARHIDALEACAPEIAGLYRQLALLTLPLALAKGHVDQARRLELQKVLAE